jgi:hypothetical protein
MQTLLDDLLDQTRDALVIGNLAALAGLAPRVATLAENLPQVDRPTAERLRRKADRNARLLQAATRGVRAAQQRLKDISAGASLVTYDAQGRRETLSGASVQMPRRV